MARYELIVALQLVGALALGQTLGAGRSVAPPNNPQGLERYLAIHPGDADARRKLMRLYDDRGNLAKLREHTFLLIRYHPDNMWIWHANVSAFYAHPTYRREVIARMEAQVAGGHREHATYATLANICGQGALPRAFKSTAERRRFLRYFMLPANTALPTRVDRNLANRAVHYYQAAIKAAGNVRFYPCFYSEQLASFLHALGRDAEAIDLCTRLSARMPEELSPDFYVTYGESLVGAKRDNEAAAILGKVREHDHEGFSDGPGHATVEAETALGLIALRQGIRADAAQHLLASCHVQKCCHNITKGFPLGLATKLLECGEREPVAEYCRTVLKDFTPDQPETKDLLRRATAPTRK